MAKTKLRVLYGEGDTEVLKAHAAEFEKAGHTVQPAESRKAVEQALKNNTFDLVVLGPTLSRNDRHHLPYMVKKVNADTSVLVMHADGSRHPYVDADCRDDACGQGSWGGKIVATGQWLVVSFREGGLWAAFFI
jgi:DNA-binding NtrC family response regulator